VSFYNRSRLKKIRKENSSLTKTLIVESGIGKATETYKVHTHDGSDINRLS
jgi:hypothetical protein